MSGKQEQAFREGADGKLYFSYNLGAEYLLRPTFAQPFIYRVASCEFDEERETEYFCIECAGELLPSRFTVERLKLLLGQLPNEKVAEGEPVEIPLLVEEVRAYFAVKRQEVNGANAEANKKLKGTEYYSHAATVRKNTELLYLAESNGETEKAAEFEKKLQELRAAQAKILSDRKIDLRVLTKAAECKLCGDSGIVGDRICDCARAISDKIKTFNAKKRLSAKK